MFDSILVVCMGNICRSPIAERLLQQGLAGKKITSAGIRALVGENADKMAFSVAKSHNLSLEGHVAKQLTLDLCKDYSLILVMEKMHIEVISKMEPEVRGKIMLLGHWINQHEIADPYHKSREMFENVYQIIDDSVIRWIKILNQ